MKPRFSVAQVHADPCWSKRRSKQKPQKTAVGPRGPRGPREQPISFICVCACARVRVPEWVMWCVLFLTQYSFFLLGPLGPLGPTLDRLRFLVVHVESSCVDHVDNGQAAGPSGTGGLRGGAEPRSVARCYNITFG